MSITEVSGSPDDFYSWQEELKTTADIERHIHVPRQLGRNALAKEIFDISHDPDSPLVIGKDPYNRFPYLHLN